MNVPKTRKVLLYTSIFGAYDELCEVPAQTIAHDAKCHSDQDFNPRTWQIEKRPLKFNDDPILTARYFKIAQSIPDYEFCVYLDGAFEITRPDFLEFILAGLSHHQIAFLTHPHRSCVYDEAAVCQTIDKCDPNVVSKQIVRYANAGMPRQYGLWAAGVFAFRNSPAVFELRQAWWQELLKGSNRDQISLPYVIWRKNLAGHIDSINQDVFDSPYVRWRPHKI
ncbi:MAG TPA: glycosyltransferase domain-containing protein [Pyrinomonadaceae bacterium]|nr:glycosyltransferase domain-containing protein [Pyrinomonadaceae bacterium]